MKPTPLVADEMFPEGAGRYLAFEIISDNMEEIAGVSGPIMIDIGGDEKAVHSDFSMVNFEQVSHFDDLFNDEDLN